VIALLDYGAGNLTSVRKALVAVGAEVRIPQLPGDLAGANGIIVPGVGNFRATAALDRRWHEAALEHIAVGRPLLGICLGMQWLFEESAEAPGLAGLGLLPGRSVLLAGDVKVPHVGWNSLATHPKSWLLDGVDDGAQAYFTHSYAAPLTPDTVATTDHGRAFASAVERGSVAGVQFHPEKSAGVGLRVLKNFVARCAAEI
jgi:glutamine amidotransferase